MPEPANRDPVTLSEVLAQHPLLVEGQPMLHYAPVKNGRDMYVVEEHIHHGQYNKRRRVEVYQINVITLDSIIRSSGYVYGTQLDTPAGTERLKQMVHDLKHGRTVEYGWSTFRAITDPKEF